MVFKYLEEGSRDFSFEDKKFKAKYYIELIKRLKLMETFDEHTFRFKLQDGYYRCHPINWNKSTKKKGFDHLANQICSDDCYQFSTGFKKGRVHGFLIGNIYHIVWIDFNHNLCPSKNR